jgi:aminoglycoside phosphotransferase (APT) family kinase protein
MRKFPSWSNVEIPHFTVISDGWENDVYSFRIGYKEGTEKKFEDLILRIYPGEGTSRKATREFSGMKRLHELGYPVPEVFILQTEDSPFGKPFVIMEKINGLPMGDILDDVSDSKKSRLIELACKMFVHLHSLDWRLFAEDLSIYETDDPNAIMDKWFMKVERYLRNFNKGEFDTALDWLKERSSDITFGRLSVIHYDYHPRNILVQNDGRAFVIDWTNIDIADFRLDLGWTILLTSTYENPESREIVLKGYEQIAGFKIKHMEYFEAAAAFRRLLSMAISLSDGADKLGMRPGTGEMIKGNVNHMKNVYSVLHEITGVSIPEIEKLISDIS